MTARSLAIVLALVVVTAAAGAIVGRSASDPGPGPGGATVATVTTTNASAVTSGAATRARKRGEQLRWAPPALNAPETVQVTPGTQRLDLDPAKDYVVDLGDRPVEHMVRINGGHNVVIVGGEFAIPRKPDGATSPGLYLRHQSDGGTVHVEGVMFRGKGLTDAIDLEQPNDVTVQIQNVHVAELHAPDERTWGKHPDVIQTWTGPSRLRVDKLTGYSPYQGLFLEPDDDFYKGPGRHHIPDSVELHRVNLRVRPDRSRVASRLLWMSVRIPLKLRAVWIDPGRQSWKKALWPNARAWPGVRRGVPPGGNYVKRETVGIRYRSPGYLTR